MPGGAVSRVQPCVVAGWPVNAHAPAQAGAGAEQVRAHACLRVVARTHACVGARMSACVHMPQRAPLPLLRMSELTKQCMQRFKGAAGGPTMHACGPSPCGS